MFLFFSHQPELQLWLFGKIMEEKFQRKSPIEFFKEFSKENLSRCYLFFLKLVDESWGNIYVSTDLNPSDSEKLLFIVSCLAVKFNAKVFKKVEPTLLESDEIVDAAVSPLPSVLLAGKSQ